MQTNEKSSLLFISNDNVILISSINLIVGHIQRTRQGREKTSFVSKIH